MSFSASLSQESEHDTLRQFLYTPIEEAIHLLDARQKQPHIDLPDFDAPEALQHPRTAVMFRQVATPNYEMRRVVELCDKYQLNLLILAFQDDKFSSHNASKHALGRMGFFEGFGRQGGKKIRYSNIIDFNQYNGRPLRECQTYRGQPLMDFHHALLFQEFPQLSPDNVFECSEWFIRHRAEAGNLYRSFLKLFLKHAILFETFLFSGSELSFTLNKVFPAFQEIVDTFGIKPLIVHSDTHEMEGDDYWQFYPDHLRTFAPYDRRKIPRLAA